MALTALQVRVGHVTRALRRQSESSYLAGGVGLNLYLKTHRLSRDIDLFHDTIEAVADAVLRAGPEALRRALAEDRVFFHPGRICGALPTIRALVAKV